MTLIKFPQNIAFLKEFNVADLIDSKKLLIFS